MNETAVFTKVAAELQIKPGQVAATAELLAGGGTVPFIARYRKEVTGMLDEVQITNVRDRLLQLAELDQRRGAIVKSLEERNLMTDALRVQIGKAETMARLEDIFAPFRPKRRTRATIAKEKGLESLAEWLLAAPLGQKRLLAIDPGFRTGCKTVVLDAQGKLLHHDVIYPTAGSQAQVVEAARTVLTLVERHGIEAIAIGNGTAGRETEAFIRKLKLPPAITVVMVNESGASIYSASDVAREEFPNEDVTVRGAVSIGRRLMDPLAELVKIDPKSIGVGQYQHDVEQHALKHSLDDCVMSCVNGVGVEVNTASKQLLSYVAGLNSGIAENVVAYRNEHGPFRTRSELKKVPRLGEKAYEQAAGFLRIRDAAHPLDASAVHPERYALVEKIAAEAGCTVAELIRDEARRKAIDLKRYVSAEVGLPTLQDIMTELSRPGRDPRKQFEAFSFVEGVEKPSDLTVGMKLPGIVTNVTAFGAFVDIGVHQDGLVHVSQLADHFIKDPNEVVKVAQQVQVTVTEVDLVRNRIALSMKTKPDFEKKDRKPGVGVPAAGGGGPRGGNERGGGRPQQGGGMGNPFGGDWFNNAAQKGKR